MFEMVCTKCNKTISFENRSDMPDECPYCFADFDPSMVLSETQNEAREVAGLTLIYQIDQQRIEIPASPKTVLGRDSFGAKILSKIFYNGKSVVSRKHCSIEFQENKIYLRDEGSLNGTYYGVNKIDCKGAPQVIENENLIYLGEEPFLAQIRFKAPKIVPQEKPSETLNITKAIKKYRCNESICGSEYDVFHAVCPNCTTYNSLLEIYE